MIPPLAASGFADITSRIRRAAGAQRFSRKRLESATRFAFSHPLDPLERILNARKDRPSRAARAPSAKVEARDPPCFWEAACLLFSFSFTLSVRDFSTRIALEPDVPVRHPKLCERFFSRYARASRASFILHRQITRILCDQGHRTLRPSVAAILDCGRSGKYE